MVDATRLGAWLRSGEGIGWLAAGITPNSVYRVPFYLLLACVFCVFCVFCYCSFLFVVSILFRYVSFVLFSALVGAFRCSSGMFLSSRPRTGLATTYITGYG